jgi:HPt (histidine-containing phosphotransfer) domain-containing protein
MIIPDLSPFPALASLQRQLGDRIVVAVVEAFLEETPGRLADLAVAMEARHWSQVTLYAHALAGSAAELGLDVLSAVARTLERSAKTSPIAIAEHWAATRDLAVSGMAALHAAFPELPFDPLCTGGGAIN